MSDTRHLNAVEPETYQRFDTDGLNSELLSAIRAGDRSRSQAISETIIRRLDEGEADTLTMSDSQYYLGLFNLLILKKDNAAAWWFRQAAENREHIGVHDEIYAKCFTNLGVVYNNLGDFRRMEEYTLKSLEADSMRSDVTLTDLSLNYSNLVNACYGLNEFEKAIGYGNQALAIMESDPVVNNAGLAKLYSNIGICYSATSDYSKALLYLEKAENIYTRALLPTDLNFINLMNNLASTYYFLGMAGKADEYFKKGFELSRLYNSFLSRNLINSFAVILANSGRIDQGEELLSGSLENARRTSGPDSKDYHLVVWNYADYKRTFRNDLSGSILLYEQCLRYLESHQEDILFRNQVTPGYALAMNQNGNSAKALSLIQDLLLGDSKRGPGYSDAVNPDLEELEPDKWTLELLDVKYRILRDIFLKSGNYNYLVAASGTSELVIALIEKIRVAITEEESRLVLGDRYRDVYIRTIRDFDMCYRHTGDDKYLGKAFEYAEKSKVAGLLASTRELKATQFHIPGDIADLERKFKSDITFYTARIAETQNSANPDQATLADWNGIVFNASRKRDSVVAVIEKKFPEYYKLKYNTRVLTSSEIPSVTGRNTNYINYIVSDTVVYLFLVNRKYSKLFSINIDSTFFRDIREFRNLLAMPSPVTDAGSDFRRFQFTGNRLYTKLMEPVLRFLVSDNLLISPDNILSFIPFEAIPAGKYSGNEILYSKIPYLMQKFRISYAYSATMMAESFGRADRKWSNNLVAFAPVYTGKISTDSLLMTREEKRSDIRDLPFARQEAEYITNLTGGRLYINNGATEKKFKEEAGNYDIVHLAMHTIINDKFPMFSKMLFYQDKNNSEDGFLNTYEVYNIPLNARMVILSSCNTGAGLLYSGEGILSLARGFVYSGSQSVVMSMWEIEDRSGTEIVKDFYDNLKKGMPKSKALRKARIRYLNNSDMLRSHPYFWSALVVYGNDAPLYRSKRDYILAGSSLFSVLLIIIFLRKKFFQPR